MIISSVANAGWTTIGKGVSGDTYYVDFERIKKHSGRVYYWTLADYLEPNKSGEFSDKGYVEAECERFRYRYLSATGYKAPMGEGQVSTTFVKGIPQKHWNYPSTDSMDGILLKAVCNHKP
jgi:hypothetical protein